MSASPDLDAMTAPLRPDDITAAGIGVSSQSEPNPDSAASTERDETVAWVRGQVSEAGLIGGTPGERYLIEHRGLRAPWHDCLRWAPTYCSRPDSTPRPCLLAAVTNAVGEIVGVHSIELDIQTAAKSRRTDKPKLSRGPVGEGTVAFRDAGEPAATLVIGEGVETVLTRLMVGPCDAHACLGAVRFVKPQPHHRRVENLADTNARDQARRLARAYADAGLAAYVVTVPDVLGPKADLNDALRDLGFSAVRMAVEDAERFDRDQTRRGLSDFTLNVGSDIEIAQRIIERLEELYGPLVVTDGVVWRFDRTHWAALGHDSLARFVHRADGARYMGANGRENTVKLNKSRVESILDAVSKYRQEPDYFIVRPCGINCESGFVRIDNDGKPELLPHARQWRQRHVVHGRWPSRRDPADREGSSLACYLREAFAGDADAAQKIKLLSEGAGCVALGHGTRVRNPKAIIAFSEDGATGKSTFLRLLRALPNSEAIASVPPGKFGDEKYAFRLIGKVLNAADELPERAIKSDVFKRMITGEPVPARDVYRSATDFVPTAQHVFSTNVLPSFSGGVDGGTARRLLPIEFTHVVPERERDPDLVNRILRDEADLLLDFAVEGACRLVQQRDFTVPASSQDLLQRWMVEADPVRRWAAERLEVVSYEHVMPIAALYADFVEWARHQGLKVEFLPNAISFGKRFRTAARGLEFRRSDGSLCRNARLRVV